MSYPARAVKVGALSYVFLSRSMT